MTTTTPPAPALPPPPNGMAAAHDAKVQQLLLGHWQITAATDQGTHLAKPLNHVLHVLIGLFTLGAWWWVWLVLALQRRSIFVPRVPGIATTASPGGARSFALAVAGMLAGLLLAIVIYAIAGGGAGLALPLMVAGAITAVVWGRRQGVR